MKNGRDDIGAELRAHIDAHVDDNVRAGMTPEEARRRALADLGGIEPTKERYRDQRRLQAIDTAVRELRHAFERLRRSPAFTVAAILSLALAIAANVAVFTVVERVVLHPLPYVNSGQLVMLDFAVPARNIPSNFSAISTRQYFHFAAHARTLSSVAAYWALDQTITGQGGSAERVRVALTTPSLASVLRVAPEAGAWLPDDRPRGPAPTVVLSHGLWVRRYGADAGILGKTITLDGKATTVVGVMPASFAFPDARVDAWVPVPFSLAPTPLDDAYNYIGVARLKDGVSLQTARAEIDQLSRSLEASAPGHGLGGLVSTALTLQDAMVGQISTTLWILLASAGVVLLVACANIANLFLVRSEARQQEISIRRALGAGTGGVAGYFLAESLLLSLAGGAAGLSAAWYGVRLLVAFGPATLPRLNEVHLAPVHLVFALALTALAAIAFTAVPLARAGRSRIALQDGTRSATASRRSHRTRQALMAAQVALALMLLVASGLLLRSFIRLRALDPGFNPSSALTFQIGLPPGGYPTRERIALGYESIRERLRTLPGVTSATAVNCVPLSGRGYCFAAPLYKEGEPAIPAADVQQPLVAMRSVAADFFETMGMPILRGRGFGDADFRPGELTTIVDEALARQAFPGENPLGRRIALLPHRIGTDPVWFTIVGLVKTTPTLALDEPRPTGKMYVPIDGTHGFLQPTDVMTYVLRTSVPPGTLASAARSAVTAIDPNLALAQVRTLQDHLDAAAAPHEFTMILILMAAGTALVLGLVGIYGVMSYVVSQRTSEIGVRIALGAEPASVMRMIVSQGALVTLGGIAAGLVVSLAGGRVISSLLYDVSPRDPQVFATTAITLLAVALVACWIPARRAANVDPLIALRTE
ncbi:MAG TPA: ABC transporter permease [Vicinamibacterales bacterium]|nr:ABC transporter permease [Vicinamibacterales bacterium]